LFAASLSARSAWLFYYLQRQAYPVRQPGISCLPDMVLFCQALVHAPLVDLGPLRTVAWMACPRQIIRNNTCPSNVARCSPHKAITGVSCALQSSRVMHQAHSICMENWWIGWHQKAVTNQTCVGPVSLKSARRTVRLLTIIPVDHGSAPSPSAEQLHAVMSQLHNVEASPSNRLPLCLASRCRAPPLPPGLSIERA
jgi:hypothetical protein